MGPQKHCVIFLYRKTFSDIYIVMLQTTHRLS
nr:MAG TPA: hypothetical protein [Caudoviricetes sp.]